MAHPQPKPDDSRPKSDPGIVSQYRQAIDSGTTADKVKVTDPAAAPLPTDAETTPGRLPAWAVRMVKDHQEVMGQRIHRKQHAEQRAVTLSAFIATGLAILLGFLLAWASLAGF